MAGGKFKQIKATDLGGSPGDGGVLALSYENRITLMKARDVNPAPQGEVLQAQLSQDKVLDFIAVGHRQVAVLTSNGSIRLYQLEKTPTGINESQRPPTSRGRRHSTTQNPRSTRTFYKGVLAFSPGQTPRGGYPQRNSLEDSLLVAMLKESDQFVQGGGDKVIKICRLGRQGASLEAIHREKIPDDDSRYVEDWSAAVLKRTEKGNLVILHVESRHNGRSNCYWVYANIHHFDLRTGERRVSNAHFFRFGKEQLALASQTLGTSALICGEFGTGKVLFHRFERSY